MQDLTLPSRKTKPRKNIYSIGLALDLNKQEDADLYRKILDIKIENIRSFSFIIKEALKSFISKSL